MRFGWETLPGAREDNRVGRGEGVHYCDTGKQAIPAVVEFPAAQAAKK